MIRITRSAIECDILEGTDEGTLNLEIVECLIHVLDEQNELVQLFRTAREKCRDSHVPEFKIRLYNMGAIRRYELTASQGLGGIVFESGPISQTDYDVIIEYKGGSPQRINKLHQSYMSLQFPLLFVFGTDKAKIPRKRLKPGKLEHEERKSTKEAGDSIANGQTLVNSWSTKVKR
ncbi:hypothetical protein Tco_1068863 [Tanacetum coccineum]|uniref:Helitron helicase-like domain-containing protein n=1 Tax=Tanacetum coccineum TaxID=301880 RepID=A0ABQ5HIC8_9ASTR